MSKEEKPKIIRKWVEKLESKTGKIHPITFVECQCSCGNLFVCRKYNYNEGSTKSCGCARKNRWKNHDRKTIQCLFDYSANRHKKAFDKLISFKGKYLKVLGVIDSDIISAYKKQFKCECRCGQIFILSGQRIPLSTGCGCRRKEHFKGENSSRALFKKEQVNLIRKLSEVYINAELAKMFDCSKSTIQQIVDNITYCDAGN